MKAAMIAFSLYSRIPMPSFPWEDRDRKNALHFFSAGGMRRRDRFFRGFFLSAANQSRRNSAVGAFNGGSAPFYGRNPHGRVYGYL